MIWSFFSLIAMIVLGVMIMVAVVGMTVIVVTAGVMISDTWSDIFRNGEHPKVALRRRAQDIKDCFGGFRSWFRWMWDGWFVEEPKKFNS